jgi:hypothetical protein
LLRARNEPEVQRRRFRIDVDLHRVHGATQGFSRWVGQEKDRLVQVPDPIHGEDGLILLDEEDRVGARNVAVIDDREPGPVHGVTEPNLADSAARGGTSYRGAPQAAVDLEVVDVPFSSGEFGEALDASHASPPARVEISAAAPRLKH